MPLLLFQNLINDHFGKILGNLSPSIILCKSSTYYFLSLTEFHCDWYHASLLTCSNFSDVFDEDHFINSLANDVKVIKKLPKELSSATKVVKHFRSWSGLEYYQDEIASLWEEYQVCLLTSLL